MNKGTIFEDLKKHGWVVKGKKQRKIKDYFIQWKDAMGEENWLLIDHITETDNPLVILYKIDTQS